MLCGVQDSTREDPFSSCLADTSASLPAGLQEMGLTAGQRPLHNRASKRSVLAGRTPVAYLQWGRSQGGEPSACQALQTPCALLCAGQHAVALAAGYLDPAPAELVRALRKQVVVVVTAGWDVLCYDHNLRLKWQASVKVTWGRQRNAMGGCMLGDAAP